MTKSFIVFTGIAVAASLVHAQEPTLGFELVGGDLTDPEDDGAPESNEDYDAIFSSSEEPGFAGGEFAFNVFDNQLGPGNSKWCCGTEGNFPDEPIWVQATFDRPYILTGFTVSSANDAQDRDPIVWELQGSNDGNEFVTIFRQEDDFPVWDSRLQVASYDVEEDFETPPAFATFRFSCEETGLTNGPRFQLGELELFGIPGNLKDTDEDGIPDSYELANNLDINVNDAADDLDGDGISNKAEYDGGLKANNVDSDGDSIPDNFETNTGTFVDSSNTGTHPARPDTDRDGLEDGVETNTGVLVSSTDRGTDPLDADTDGDGFEDGKEVTLGSDPLLRSSVPAVPIFRSELLGMDLTDPEDDGDPESEDSYNAIFDSSEEPEFGGAESAFNVFDNVLGPTNDKWCCGDLGDPAFPEAPIWVAATFENPIVLTHFTISSANDAPNRDPLIWEIQGSNDGESFTTIYRQEDTESIWGTDRLQVAELRAGSNYNRPSAYRTIRFICFETALTGGPRFQLGELEFFGTVGNIVPFQITEVNRIANEGKELLQIVFPSTLHGTYAIEISTSLTIHWEEIVDGVESQGETTVYQLELAEPTPDLQFIRVRAE